MRISRRENRSTRASQNNRLHTSAAPKIESRGAKKKKSLHRLHSNHQSQPLREIEVESQRAQSQPFIWHLQSFRISASFPRNGFLARVRISPSLLLLPLWSFALAVQGSEPLATSAMPTRNFKPQIDGEAYKRARYAGQSNLSATNDNCGFGYRRIPIAVAAASGNASSYPIPQWHPKTCFRHSRNHYDA